MIMHNDVEYADMPSSFNNVSSIDNHIYISGEIDEQTYMTFAQTLYRVDKSLRSHQVNYNIDSSLTPIWIHINSGGGDVFSGLACADAIKSITRPVYAIIEGLCASAATFFAVSCDKAYITFNSIMLVHQLSAMFWGTHEQFKDDLDLQQKIMTNVVNLYHNKTGMSKKQIKKILKREFSLNAREAIDMGFVDDYYTVDVQ